MGRRPGASNSEEPLTPLSWRKKGNCVTAISESWSPGARGDRGDLQGTQSGGGTPRRGKEDGATNSSLVALFPRLPPHLLLVPPPCGPLPSSSWQGAEAARPQEPAPWGTDRGNKGREQVGEMKRGKSHLVSFRGK